MKREEKLNVLSRLNILDNWMRYVNKYDHDFFLNQESDSWKCFIESSLFWADSIEGKDFWKEISLFETKMPLLFNKLKN